ncbi:MAG TPA: thioesterase family protein [Flavisolibacter sp.]|nr:thioesterase family protein [Flavisolibacter sp.]
MSRIKIHLPEEFHFSTEISIRITDLNYGGHVGNDTVFSLLHESRMRFLQHQGLSELEFEDASLIMADAGVEFKSEIFYGDVVKAFVAAGDFSKIGFSVYYKLIKIPGDSIVTIAKTGMICYDYNKKKIVAVPDKARAKLISATRGQ